MIRTFANDVTKDIFQGRTVPGLSLDIQRRALVKLMLLNAAAELEDLAAVRTNRLELLSGEREGRHCISVDDKGRICFRWSGNDAYDVELFGYH